MIRNKKGRITAQVISTDDKKITVSIVPGSKSFKKGQNIVATTNVIKTTALGEEKKVSSIVARGMVTNVTDSRITIEVKNGRTMSSRSVLQQIKEQKLPISLHEIKNVSYY